MFVLLRGFILAIAMGMLSFPAYAEEVSKEQIKNLDEQVQEIKTETLNLGVQMRLLEEKLLYPSSTQVAVFVSLDKAAKFRLDSIEIQLDDKLAAQHLYTLRELEALQNGGMQRIYTGNIKSGEHGLQVLVTGKTAGGSGLRAKESFKFSKDEKSKVVEIHLVDSGSHIITLRDW
ncbi:MAG TPA: hypothetical protein VN604_01740 [Nitrospirota bacterium]|nr:hypothetical protein [Nitrospirota bacterium]